MKPNPEINRLRGLDEPPPKQRPSLLWWALLGALLLAAMIGLWLWADERSAVDEVEEGAAVRVEAGGQSPWGASVACCESGRHVALLSIPSLSPYLGRIVA